MLIITRGYVQVLVFFVKRIFSFLSHIELWWCQFQIRHNSLLRQSGALSFIPVQLKQSFFFESIRMPSSTLFTDSNWLALWPSLSQKKNMHGGKGLLLLFLFEKHLSFYVFDHYFLYFWSFCQSTFLMSPLVLQSFIPASYHQA